MKPLSPEDLDRLQRDAFGYFAKNTNPETGLVADCTRPGSPSSIAACGLALAAYPVAVERGYATRDSAAQSAARMLGFFAQGEQGEGEGAIGNRGFFYHFLDMASGRRVWNCEVSTIDSAYVFAGALAAARYFAGDDRVERAIRELADAVYRRADWEWARDARAAAVRDP
ncbi:MAG TPA: hypothetical protein VFL12_08715, partial [Thermoanaerobaculia bacterium]|nr:hypothetical protein [Thermoanaerobaculia bacterium]